MGWYGSRYLYIVCQTAAGWTGWGGIGYCLTSPMSVMLGRWVPMNKQCTNVYDSTCIYSVDANCLSRWRLSASMCCLFMCKMCMLVCLSAWSQHELSSLSGCFSPMLHSDVLNQSQTQHPASESNCSQGMVNSFSLKGIVFPVIVLRDLQISLWKVPLWQISFHQIYRLPVSRFSVFLAP